MVLTAPSVFTVQTGGFELFSENRVYDSFLVVWSKFCVDNNI